MLVFSGMNLQVAHLNNISEQETVKITMAMSKRISMLEEFSITLSLVITRALLEDYPT